MQMRHGNGRFAGNLPVKIILVVFFLVIGASFAVDYFEIKSGSIDYVAEQVADLSIPDTKEKIEARIKELKLEVLAQVKKGETHGYVVESGELFYTHDPRMADRPKCSVIGGKRSLNCDSWGELQFKIPTVQMYAKQLTGETLTEIEAMLTALDPLKADALATNIIFNVKGGIMNWQNTYNASKEYFETNINLVRELEALIK